MAMLVVFLNLSWNKDYKLFEKIYLSLKKSIEQISNKELRYTVYQGIFFLSHP